MAEHAERRTINATAIGIRWNRVLENTRGLDDRYL